jgi:hypothetical protein
MLDDSRYAKGFKCWKSLVEVEPGPIQEGIKYVVNGELWPLCSFAK